MLSLILFAATSALAAPPTPPQPPSPPNMEERGGGDESDKLMKHFPEIAERLGLTADQRTKVETLYYENKLAGIDLKAKSERARLELQRGMLATTDYDEKAVLKSFESAAAAETEVKRNELKLMLSLRKVLTAEQWAQLKDMREERREGRRERRHEEEEDDEHERDDD